MRLIFLIWSIVFLSGCTKTTWSSTSDGYTRTTTKCSKQIVYYYRPDSTLRSVSYFTKLKAQDSVFTFDSAGVLEFQGMKNQLALDSIYYYDEQGLLIQSFAYPGKISAYSEQPNAEVTYWSNGMRKSVLRIDRVDTVETSTDYGVINIKYFYSGHLTEYSSTGRLAASGDFAKGKRCGVWYYYSDDQKVIKVDTLR